MSELLLGNVGDDIPDEEIQAFLTKYGFPPFDGIERLPGDDVPSVRLSFKETDEETLRNLRSRIQDIYWKDRRLQVEVMAARYL